MTEPRQLREIGERAAQELAHLLHAPAERVTGLRRVEHGWSAVIEVLEMSRVPETADIMADYEVDLTAKGTVVGFRRTRRYLRSDVEGS